jgi:isoquinoline 1-oxidoreductase beta subunit
VDLQIDRRTFLKTTLMGFTGLTLSCTIGPWPPNGESSGLTIWINISEDNQVTITVVKSEMGQGVTTALPMIIAEELEANWENVRFELRSEVPPYILTLSPTTTWSYSVNSLYLPLRRIGAAAKEMLIKACAQRWEVHPKTLRAENSHVSHSTLGSISYGELTEEASKLPIPLNPQLKDPSEFTIIGQPFARLDASDHVEGRTVYGTDVVIPDMLYAAVRHSPVFGGNVSNFDLLTGNVDDEISIFLIPGGVAAVAESHWRAEKVLRSLDVEFNLPEEMKNRDSAEISDILARDLKKPGMLLHNKGFPEVALQQATQKVDATYDVPFLAHAAMEPMTCTAKVTEDRCEIWIPTQDSLNAQLKAAQITGLKESAIDVYPTNLGGGFGRKIETDCVEEAVTLSQSAGRPVKVIWSRTEDMQHDFYRPVFRAELSGGIGADGLISSWISKSAGPLVASFAYIVALPGLAYAPYDIPNMRISYSPSDTGVPVGFWRSVSFSQNIFFIESFIDELAYMAEANPFNFRIEHLKNSPRKLAVLETVAQMSNWGQPKASGAAHGLALSDEFGSIVAQVAEVSVENGTVIVHKVYCAIDCGTVVNPDIVKAQLEGGIIFGLTAALYGEITLKSGRVQQTNFNDYPLVMLKNAPAVQISIINSEKHPRGIGEVGVPPIAPAVTNAIFAATGHRIRILPISRYEFT